MILDVGCGNFPRGDVNVDLYPEATMQRNRAASVIVTRQIPNFVRADIHSLPFKAAAFELVTCFWVLEHKGVDFTRALRELLRVSSSRVRFGMPHRFWQLGIIKKRHSEHDKYFTVSQLARLLNHLGLHLFNIEVIRRGYPHPMLPLLMMPEKIIVTIVKEQLDS